MQGGNGEGIPSIRTGGGPQASHHCGPRCSRRWQSQEWAHMKDLVFSVLTWIFCVISPACLSVYPQPQERHWTEGQQVGSPALALCIPRPFPGARPRAGASTRHSARRAEGRMAYAGRLQSKDKAGRSQPESQSPEKGSVHGGSPRTSVCTQNAHGPHRHRVTELLPIPLCPFTLMYFSSRH